LLYQAAHDRAADKQCTAFRVYAIVWCATRNLLERAVLLTDGEVIRPEALLLDHTPVPRDSSPLAKDHILPLD